ncbi:MAG: serine hydrolase [Kofleriaceae bacterium]
MWRLGGSACVEPETTYTYSNYGFDVLGSVLAVLWGYDGWNDLADDVLYTPLGMGHTCREAGSCFPDWNTSHAFGFDSTGNHVDLPGFPAAATAEGGLFTTGADMAKWLLFLTGYGPASTTRQRDLVGVPATISGSLADGHGWSFDFRSLKFNDGKTDTVRVKGGYLPGMTTYLSIDDTRHAAVFVYVNRDPDTDSQDTILRSDFVEPILKTLN